MRRTVSVGLALVLGALLALAGAPPALAGAQDEVAVTALVSRAGRLDVSLTLTLAGDPGVSELVVAIPRYSDRDGARYRYTVDQIAVMADQISLTPRLEQRRDAQVVSFPVGSASQFDLSYTVFGATTTMVGGAVELTWQLVGGLNIDVGAVTATVQVPPGASNYDCQAGVPGALVTCTTYNAGLHGNTSLEITQHPLAAGQVVQAQVTWPAGAVEVTERVGPVWGLGRAFTAGGQQLVLMALVLVVGGLVLFAWWRTARPASFRGQPVTVAGFAAQPDGTTRFVADPDARPGMIGTLVDSSVDPADVLATMVDLAVRGHLLITELDTPGRVGPDWMFARRAGAGPLKAYEQQLLDALTTGQVRVSELSQAVVQSIGPVQAAVLREVQSTGWFSRPPTRPSPAVGWAWAGLGAAVALTAAAVAVTTMGLVGLALIAVAASGLAIAYQRPPTTAKGVAVLAGLGELARQLHTQPSQQIPPELRYAEISRLLPYAVVLGGWDRWLAALVAADDDLAADPTDLDWYHAPPDWHLAQLPASLDAFITAVTGRLFARL